MHAENFTTSNMKSNDPVLQNIDKEKEEDERMIKLMNDLSAKFEPSNQEDRVSQIREEKKGEVSVIKEENTEGYTCMYIKLLDEDRRRWLIVKFKEVYCSDPKFEEIGDHKFFLHRNLTKKLKGLIFRDDAVFIGLDGNCNLYIEILFTINEHEGIEGDEDNCSYLTATLDLNKIEDRE